MNEKILVLLQTDKRFTVVADCEHCNTPRCVEIFNLHTENAYTNCLVCQAMHCADEADWRHPSIEVVVVEGVAVYIDAQVVTLETAAGDVEIIHSLTFEGAEHAFRIGTPYHFEVEIDIHQPWIVILK